MGENKRGLKLLVHTFLNEVEKYNKRRVEFE